MIGMILMAVRHMLQKLDGSDRQLKTVMNSMRVLERDFAELKLKYNELRKLISGQQTVRTPGDVEAILRKLLPIGVNILVKQDGPYFIIRIGPTRFN